MDYVVKRLPKKKSDPKWKVQFSSRKKSLAKNKDAKYPSRAWDIPKERWSGIGIHKNMCLEEVRARVKQLNAQLAVKRNEELKLKHEERLRRFDQEVCAYLPKEYKEEFEARFFHHYRDQKRLKQNKKMSHWRAAQRLIIHLKIEPTMWGDNLIQIYDWIAEQQYSPNYYKQVLRIFNEWGFFISRKTDRTFIPISYPKGLERARLLDIYYSKEERSKAKHLIPLIQSNLKEQGFF